jgi:uncharacterized membrane protein
METDSFAARCGAQATVDAPAELVFEYLDDFEQLGAHMTRSSWMMAGSRMSYEFDEAKGRRPGARIHLLGSFLGLQLDIEERVVERVTPRSKAWQTVGEPRMLVLARYRMGYSLQPQPRGCRVTVFIEYALPATGFGRLLGWLAGRAYARWCVRSVLHQTVARFGSVTDAAATFRQAPDKAR